MLTFLGILALRPAPVQAHYLALQRNGPTRPGIDVLFRFGVTFSTNNPEGLYGRPLELDSKRNLFQDFRFRPCLSVAL